MTPSEPPRKEAGAPSAQHPVPRLHRTRAILQVMLALAVLLPCGFVVWYAWASYQSTRSNVEREIENMVSVAEEHALKVLQINEQINSRVVEMLGNKSDAELRRNEKKYHLILERIGADMPQIQSINVFAADGSRLVSSRFFPVDLGMTISDREDFYTHSQDSNSGIFVSPLFRGRTSKAIVFNMSVARRDERFFGVVNTSLDPAYFADYYKQIVDGMDGAAIALIHRSGSLLVRYPSAGEFVQFSADDPLILRFNTGEHSGNVELKSEVDGQQRYVAFRRVGKYPLFLSASYPRAAWVAAWHKQVVNAAAFTFVPSFALWILLIVTLMRLKREEEGWDQWRAEVTQRQSMELAYKQARRLEALGQLTGGVAHDFNNLLMVVSTSTMILRRQMKDAVSEQPLGSLERSIEAGKRLTRQLLAFSRKQPLRPEVLDVPGHIRDFIELVRTSLGGAIQLNLEIDANVKPIYADDAEFELALLNLALNARDAMAEGGRLTVRVRELPCGKDNDLKDDCVAIEFEDIGHGIEPQNLERIFEPFFTTKAPGRGTGLGLAQVRAFCEEAGGIVRVKSTPGAGTTVIMLLPVSERAVVVPEPSQAEVFALASGRVLLVEDNPEVAIATRVLLEQLGYTVEIDVSGEDAAARLEQDRDWVLVVSDVLMPKGMSGIGLAQTLHESRPDLPILLITGYTAQLEQAKAAGLRVLAKPFDAIALRKAIDEIIGPQVAAASA